MRYKIEQRIFAYDHYTQQSSVVMIELISKVKERGGSELDIRAEI